MAEKKLSGRQIKDLFYTEVSTETEEGGNETTTTFRCRCGKLRAQSLKHGYTNLTQHILMKHPEWITALMEDLNIIPRASASHQPSSKEKVGAGNMRALGSMIKHYREIRTKSAPGVSSPAVDGISNHTTDVGPSDHLQQPAPSPLQQRHVESREQQQQQQQERQQEQTPTTITDVETPPLSASSSTNGTRTDSTAISTSASASSSHKECVQKRADYLTWDDYFMSVAFLSAMRSKGTVL